MNSIPKVNVGAAGLAGILASVIQMVLDHDVYNFDAVYALIFAVAVAAAGYMAGKNKSFMMLVAAPVATLIAAFVGYLLYGVQWDNAAVSVALSAFLVAFVGYVAPTVFPDPEPPTVHRQGLTGRPTK